jgi:hypothetical protein
MSEVKSYDGEELLDDDYPVYLDYWYVCDGEPKRCPLFGMDGDNPTVRDLRRTFQCKEVRRCNIMARLSNGDGRMLW